MTDKNNSIYAPYFEKNNEPFFMKIGNTTYEVSTHFNPKGRENVLQLTYRIKAGISFHNRHCGIASVQYLYIAMPCCQ